jgi:ribosomal protein S18 acetylase RimI-like enzyme
MNGILYDLSPDRLISAIEENFSTWIPVFGKLGQTYFDNPPGVKRATTDIPSGLFNSITDARLAPDQVDATIQFILSDARSRNVPVIWWTGPLTKPADLGGHLEEHGFIHSDNSPGMAVELANLNESLAAPEGLSIQLVQDEATRRQWSTTMLSGFGVSPLDERNVNAWCSIVREAGLETAQPFLGWLDGKPVATSLLFLGGGVAGIYSVGTIPEARRRGIGAWMTQHTLLQGRSMGYKAGVLSASNMGLNVYRSLGFQEYCKINEYLWKPA